MRIVYYSDDGLEFDTKQKALNRDKLREKAQKIVKDNNPFVCQNDDLVDYLLEQEEQNRIIIL